MKVTRRVFGVGLVGLVSAGVLAGGASGSGDPSAERLQADLAERLVRNPGGAAFSVPDFKIEAAPGAVRMMARVRLDWSPGVRTRHFAASAVSAEDAYGALRAAAFAEFAGVVPGFDGTDRIA